MGENKGKLEIIRELLDILLDEMDQEEQKGTETFKLYLVEQFSRSKVNSETWETLS